MPAAEHARRALADDDARDGRPIDGIQTSTLDHAGADSSQIAAAHGAQRRAHRLLLHLRQRPSLRHERAKRDLFADHHAVMGESGGDDVGQCP